MGVNSLPKTVTRQRRDCDLNPGRSAPESSTLTTRLPSHARYLDIYQFDDYDLAWIQPTNPFGERYLGTSATPIESSTSLPR